MRRKITRLDRVPFAHRITDLTGRPRTALGPCQNVATTTHNANSSRDKLGANTTLASSAALLHPTLWTLHTTLPRRYLGPRHPTVPTSPQSLPTPPKPARPVYLPITSDTRLPTSRHISYPLPRSSADYALLRKEKLRQNASRRPGCPAHGLCATREPRAALLSSLLFPCVIQCLSDIHITSPRLTGTIAAQSRLGPWQSFCHPYRPRRRYPYTRLVRKPGIRSGLRQGQGC
ncbi:hypothetical protein QBC41DRAFT_41994 [Cercophora samala]|uniref:Uncharacterized protein n=1 Tax=Cercophora samala TaxID=330535 RepID=A0AA39ZIR4_9PEZI|nr:hypothetical protein QBC41DRAFT_41994 [Cercophora samala]